MFKLGKNVYSYPSAHVEDQIQTFVQAKIDAALEFQSEKLKRKAKISDVTLDDDVDIEDAEAEAFAKKVAKLSTTTNFDNLAPFFGFSGASGLRQWYLKHALRKIKALKIGSEYGNKNAFSKLYEETFEAIAPYLADAIESKIM